MQYIRHLFEFLQATIDTAGYAGIATTNNDFGVIDPVKNYGSGQQAAANLPCQKPLNGFHGMIPIQRVPKNEPKRITDAHY
jgi:hypothetical protein